MGPTGAVQSCRGEEPTLAPKWRLGATSAASASELVFFASDDLTDGGPLTPRLTRRSVSASVAYRLDRTWTLGAGLGASVTGDFDLGDETHELAPGFIAVISASRTLADMDPYFVVMGMSLGVSSVGTRLRGGVQQGQLTAGDVRLNITAGRLLLDAIAPYAVLRLFGGPVIWQRDDRAIAGGTDRYHVQAGLGLLVSAAAGFDGFVEFAPVGERSLTVGMGVAF